MSDAPNTIYAILNDATANAPKEITIEFGLGLRRLMRGDIAPRCDARFKALQELARIELLGVN